MYYISSGEKTKMYTLRENYLERHQGYIIERDFYVRNLSTDPDKALQVARDLGYEVDSKPDFTLEEIRRNKSEAEAKRYEEYRIAEQRERELRENQQIDMIKAGLFPFGKYRSLGFEQAPESYIQYWLKTDIEETNTVARSLVNALEFNFPWILERIERSSGNGEYFGEIKQRYQNLKGEIVGVAGFENFYGWQNVYNILLETGELAVYMGSAFIAYYDDERNDDVFGKVGDIITFAGTVKDHNEYKEVKQTKLARLTLKEMNGVKIKKGERVA